ncbi:metallophosphoesterase [Clostridium sp. WILCCON 0269]|uniref:Phosphoesterase n=1 Tax=Candidatus Clostridium eludens TaxID=3381663 RepID=A0ABW8SE20_9CLOT
MQIGVVSDTHRYKKFMNKVVEALCNTELVIHLGDNVQDVQEIKKIYTGPVISVKGNCDFNVDVPGEKLEVINGKRFFITHGHRYDVKYSLSRLKYRAMEEKADIVLFGHTHISQIFHEEGMWFINPGSPSVPRDGFNSIVIIDIDKGIISPSIKGI